MQRDPNDHFIYAQNNKATEHILNPALTCRPAPIPFVLL